MSLSTEYETPEIGPLKLERRVLVYMHSQDFHSPPSTMVMSGFVRDSIRNGEKRILIVGYLVIGPLLAWRCSLLDYLKRS